MAKTSSTHGKSRTKATNEGGFIYCARNPLFPLVVKIGITTQSTEDRLSSSLLPEAYEIVFAFEVEHNLTKLEQSVHAGLQAYLYKPQSGSAKEFFYACAIDKARRIVEPFSIRDVTKETQEELKEAPTSQTKAIYRSFWEEFDKQFQKRNPKAHAQRREGHDHQWLNIYLGRGADVHLSNTCSVQKQEAKVRLYIENRASNAEGIYKKLKSHKRRIEEAIGKPLEWTDDKQGRRMVSLLRPNTDFRNAQSKSTKDALAWMVEYTDRFYKVFGKELRKGDA